MNEKTIKEKAKSFIAAVAVVLLAGCSTPKNIVYYQDLEAGMELRPVQQEKIRIQPADRLSIIVTCQDLKLTNLLNLPTATIRIGQQTTISNGGEVAGYTVDSNGDIDFPAIGKVNIAGKTREEVAAHIKELLQTHELVKEPVVTVEFLNLGVTVSGEVANPGRYNIIKDNMTILEALSMAGDLTINGKRENVKVMRTENGVQTTYEINLLSANSVVNSPIYYVRQNDIIYVEPNDQKVRQSTVNGNNVRSTSFWFSLTSMLMSVAILITNL